MDRERHRVNNGFIPHNLVHYRIKGGIKPCDDIPEVALMLAGIGTNGELAINGGTSKHFRILNHCPDCNFYPAQAVVNLDKALSGCSGMLIGILYLEVQVEITLGQFRQVLRHSLDLVPGVITVSENGGKICNHLNVADPFSCLVDQVCGVLFATRSAPVEETFAYTLLELADTATFGVADICGCVTALHADSRLSVLDLAGLDKQLFEWFIE